MSLYRPCVGIISAYSYCAGLKMVLHRVSVGVNDDTIYV